MARGLVTKFCGQGGHAERQGEVWTIRFCLRHISQCLNLALMYLGCRVIFQAQCEIVEGDRVSEEPYSEVTYLIVLLFRKFNCKVDLRRSTLN